MSKFKEARIKGLNSIRIDAKLLKKVWKYSPSFLVVTLFSAFLSGINSSIQVLYVKYLFNAIGDKAPFEEILKIVGIYSVILVFLYLVTQWYMNIFHPSKSEQLRVKMHTELFEKATSLDIDKYDDPEFYNDFVWAMDEAYTHSIELINGTHALIARIISFVTLTGVLFSTDVLMATIVLILSVLRLVLSVRFININMRMMTEMLPIRRKLDYIKRVFRFPDYAKDLRITRIDEKLLEEHMEASDERIRVRERYSPKRVVIEFFRMLIVDSGQLLLLIMMLYKVMVTHTATFGGLAVAVNAGWKMINTLRDIFDRFVSLDENGLYIEKMFAFLDTKTNILSGKDEVPAFEKLEIKNVGFTYHAQEDEETRKKMAAASKKVSGRMGAMRRAKKTIRQTFMNDGLPALTDVSLEIKKGEKIAIVGYNGAGKTTLIKLLMRLYEPESGEVLYNGKNIKDFRLDEYRDHISAVFQDYRIFACTLAENVAGGRFDEADRDKVIDALKRSNFDSKLAKLKDGIDTQLTREFEENGTELSGGEQQKVAIARAFFKNADIIILDEPSAALDPDAEYKLNCAISEFAEDKAVIFISHRLSTTRNADRIYMFEKGRLIESGTHDELIRLNGKYAFMFNLQAKNYRKEV